MATIVKCNCGAEYRPTEEKFLVPHTGDAVCAVCGAALESWLESTHVPTYELIERPPQGRPQPELAKWIYRAGPGNLDRTISGISA
jgi:hypothetical protein